MTTHRAASDTAGPVLVWFRRDLRLADNPALHAAVAGGRPIVPLFVRDETEGVRQPGGAGRWWLDRSLADLAKALEARGSRLLLRRGPAAEVVRALVEETGAGAVFWNRLYDPGAVDRDAALKAALTASGVEVVSCNGSLLTEPWSIATKTGGAFKVFTPFWRAARGAIDPEALPPPGQLAAPERWPRSDVLAEWGLSPRRPDWSTGFDDDWTAGEAGALARLHRFVDEALSDYVRARDRPSEEGSSRLSPHLHWGEIGPRQLWRAVQAATAAHDVPDSQAEKFFAELGWREFNHQLLFNRPDLGRKAFKPAFDALPWRHAPAELKAWREGRTGYPIVDAGMRQLWTTGWMHNRVRLVTGSFLVKHLLIDWREGERWFWDTLVDADEANNAGNWQWVAGSGADASPFFRIFNPVAQGQRFDPQGDYVRRWVPELAQVGADRIHAPWETGGVEGYPEPIVDHGLARARALEALRGAKG